MYSPDSPAIAVPPALVELLARSPPGPCPASPGSGEAARLWKEYLDPFFAALGWKMPADPGCAWEEGTEVRKLAFTLRDGTEHTGSTFHVDGVPRFIVVLVGTAGDPEGFPPAFPFWRYAWSVEIPLLVLTNVVAWSVHDCTREPAITGDCRVSPLLTFKLQNLPDAWGRISTLLQRHPAPALSCRGRHDTVPAVKGEEQQEAGYSEERQGGELQPGGARSVAQVLLGDLESLRKVLARRVADENHGISTAYLNDAVHQEIYRVLLVQLCNDRHIHLLPTVDRPPDGISPALTSNPAIAQIYERFLGPGSPYELGVVPLPTLAAVLDRFLEKRIRMRGGHRPEVEPRPGTSLPGSQVRPPHAVVDYLTRQLVRDLTSVRPTPREMTAARILDPACGAGLFLSAIYQALLDWHLDWYLGHQETGPHPLPNPHGPGPDEQHDRSVEPGRQGWKLSFREKVRILTAMLHGVDIDCRAAGAAVLLLIIHLLRDEDGTDPNLPQMTEYALCRLRENIRCGNALIGPDYFDLGQSFPYQFRVEQKVSPFSWHAAFPLVIERGGFDAVTGHPPIAAADLTLEQKQYLQTHYEVYQDMDDLTPFFIEKGLSLLAPGGELSLFVPAAWLRARTGRPLRRYLAGRQIREITRLYGVPVGEGAFCVLRVSDTPPVHPFLASRVQVSFLGPSGGNPLFRGHLVDQATLSEGGWTLEDTRPERLLLRLKAAGRPLGAYVLGQVTRGIGPGQLPGPLLHAMDISRYAPMGHYYYAPQGIQGSPGPAGQGPGTPPHPAPIRGKPFFVEQGKDLAHSSGQKRSASAMQERVERHGVFGEPAPRVQPRIIGPSHARRPSFTLETAGRSAGEDVTLIPYPDLYLLGLLNSRITGFFICMTTRRAVDGTYSYTPRSISRIPVYIPDFEDKDEAALHNRVEELVEQLLSMHGERALLPGGPSEGPARATLDQRIRAAEEAVNEALYGLYGVTEEERRLIECKVAED